MSNPKFTPGKWNQAHREKKNGMYSTEVFSDTGETIASISWYPMPPERIIFEGKPKMKTGTCRAANARLIAKAPELYAFAVEMAKRYPLSPWINEEANRLIKEINGND